MSKEPCFPEYKILLVDDEEAVVDNYEFALASAGLHNLLRATDSRVVETIFSQHTIGILFLDLMMPGISGKDILLFVKQHSPQTEVVIVTAVDDVHTAVECMKEGAADYLVKPVSTEKICATARRMEERLALTQEIAVLRESLLHMNDSIPEPFSAMSSICQNMTAVINYANGIAKTGYPVLIAGETGVGKELMAQGIHRASGRKGEFVAINIAGLGEHEFSDVLFGHSRGAFTGADSYRQGLIAKAENGTLFLDEIGDLAAESQVKLLRFLADRRYYPLGCDTPSYSSTRILAATNRPLTVLAKSSSFRSDLFYRLNTHCVEIPPLRHRRDDIPLLFDRFIDEASEQLGKPKPSVHPSLFQLLDTYDFPGNVRELQALTLDAVGRHVKGTLALEAFTSRIFRDESCSVNENTYDDNRSSHPDRLVFPDTLPPLATIENLLIREAMQRADGNQSLAAKLLKVPRKTLNTRIIRMKND